MALALEGIAREHPEDGMVGTVGRIEALPGAVNIIPGRVVFTVDLRALTDALRAEAAQRFQAAAESIAAARGLTDLDRAVPRDRDRALRAALQEALAASIIELGHRPIRLPSGAGHDAQMMARLCPSAMLFVRCRGGISHNPAEFASPHDMGLADRGADQLHRTVQTMSDFIERNFSREVELLKALVRVPSDNPPGVARGTARPQPSCSRAWASRSTAIRCRRNW